MKINFPENVNSRTYSKFKKHKNALNIKIKKLKLDLEGTNSSN